MEAPLELVDVRKSYGRVVALRGVSFSCAPGRVCGLLGANGAGKSTALRVLLGLVRADSGRALVGGAAFGGLDAPAGVVGAVLESVGVRPDRSGRDHLRVAARRLGVGPARVESLLSLVGLSDAAGRAAGGYSLGMRQRLAVACVLLGDPAALVLDEPANGLDPPGRRGLGGLLRDLAAEGRTVLLSSHVLAEVERLADVATNTAADVRDALSNASVSGLVALLFGVVVAGGESRHRTLAGVLLLQPRRARVVVAQAAALGLCGATFAMGALLLALVVVAAILVIGGAGLPLGAGVVGVIVRAVVYGALCGAAGAGLGHATGSQAGGVLAASASC